MVKKMQDLHDSYKSFEARKVVDYMWGIIDKSIPFEEFYEIIKSVADDSEYLFSKTRRAYCEICRVFINVNTGERSTK